MIYFSPMPETLEELKKVYRKLSRTHHPDIGGSDDIMKLINGEYTELFRELKDIHLSSTGEKYHKETKETPEQLIKLMNQLHKARKWVDSAENDFLEAEYIEQTMDENSFDRLWRCCHHAAEKYLKALMIFKCKLPPKDKNLLKLIEICEKFAKIDLTYIYRDCEQLEDCRIKELELNYSDIKYNPAEQALRNAEKIRYFVTNYLEEFLIGAKLEIHVIGN